VNLGVPELLIVLVVVLLLFGANRLPKLARSLGEASREFHRGTKDEPASSGAPDTVHGDAGSEPTPGGHSPS